MIPVLPDNAMLDRAQIIPIENDSAISIIIYHTNLKDLRSITHAYHPAGGHPPADEKRQPVSRLPFSHSY